MIEDFLKIFGCKHKWRYHLEPKGLRPKCVKCGKKSKRLISND